METGRHRGGIALAFAATAAAVAVGAVGLGFFGVGAELAKPKAIVVTIRNRDVEPEIASQVRVGDRLFTDSAGVAIGEVIGVKVVPQPTVVPDAKGELHLHGDPMRVQIDTTVRARGREGNGLVVLDTQVVQAGQCLNLISKRYYLNGTVVSVDVSQR